MMNPKREYPINEELKKQQQKGLFKKTGDFAFSECEDKRSIFRWIDGKNTKELAKWQKDFDLVILKVL